MKAEEKTFAFMFFSVVMQFVYSLGKKQQKTVFRDGGREVERDKSRGTGGQNACGG